MGIELVSWLGGAVIIGEGRRVSGIIFRKCDSNTSVVIYFKHMRTKKQGKNGPEPVQLSKTRAPRPSPFKIKFDASITNISCFINPSKSSLKLNRKKSYSLSPSKPSLSKGKNRQQPSHKLPPTHQDKRDNSPDIVRESSNSILATIEEKGINCAWNDMEDHNEIQDVNDISIWSAFDNKSNHEKSFASTADFHHYHTIKNPVDSAPYTQTWAPIMESQSMSQSVSCVNLFEIQAEEIQRDWRTTLMIRNVPNKYTIGDLAAQIDAQLPNTYDFLYLPCDFKNQCNVGYGFINFVDTESLQNFYTCFHNYRWKKYRSEKICALTYARLQGLSQLLEHFLNSKVLNQKDKKYRPIIKYDNIHKMVLEQQSR